MKSMPRHLTLRHFGPALLLCAALFLASPLSVMAATYYVATNGNDSNSGNSSNPFRTVQKAANVAGAGDTVYVRAGTYAPFEIVSSGNASSPIIFSAAPGDEKEATIDGDLSGGYGNNCISARGESYIEILNFNIIDCARDGIFIEGSAAGDRDVRIAGNRVYHTGNSGIYAAGLIMGQTTGVDEYRLFDLLIEDNDVSRTNEPTGGNEAITVGGGLDGFVIRNNYVHDSEQYGIDAKFGAINGEIYGNTVHNIEKHAIYIDSNSRRIQNIKIYNNRLYDSNNGIILSREAAREPRVPNLHDIYIYNNIIYGNDRYGIMAYKHPNDNETGLFDNVSITNNTIYNNTLDGVRFVGIGDYATNFTLGNNIIYGNNPNVRSELGSELEQYGNTTNPNSTSAGAGNITTAPITSGGSTPGTSGGTTNTTTQREVNSCIADADTVVTLDDNYGYTRYRDNNVGDNTTFDATNGVWLSQSYSANDIYGNNPQQSYPIMISGGSNMCFAGGYIDGTNPLDANRSDFYGTGVANGAGIFVGRDAYTPNFTLDGTRMDNVIDGIRIGNAPNFTIKNAHLSYIRDDCIENDIGQQAGVIENSLFDGCYVFLSVRSNSNSTDHSNRTITVRNTLVRMEPMPGPDDGGAGLDPGYGMVFKWDGNGPKLRIENSIFYVPDAANASFSAADFSDEVESCSNNTIVWGGSGDYPYPLPDCFTVTRDESVWENAKSEWLDGNQYGGDTTDSGDTTTGTTGDTSSPTDGTLFGRLLDIAGVDLDTPSDYEPPEGIDNILAQLLELIRAVQGLQMQILTNPEQASPEVVQTLVGIAVQLQIILNELR